MTFDSPRLTYGRPSRTCAEIKSKRKMESNSQRYLSLGRALGVIAPTPLRSQARVSPRHFVGAISGPGLRSYPSVKLIGPTQFRMRPPLINAEVRFIAPSRLSRYSTRPNSLERDIVSSIQVSPSGTSAHASPLTFARVAGQRRFRNHGGTIKINETRRGVMNGEEAALNYVKQVSLID